MKQQNVAEHAHTALSPKDTPPSGEPRVVRGPRGPGAYTVVHQRQVNSLFEEPSIKCRNSLRNRRYFMCFMVHYIHVVCSFHTILRSSCVYPRVALIPEYFEVSEKRGRVTPCSLFDTRKYREALQSVSP